MIKSFSEFLADLKDEDLEKATANTTPSDEDLETDDELDPGEEDPFIDDGDEVDPPEDDEGKEPA